VIDLDRRLTVTREEAGAKVPHEIQARGVRGGNDASGLVILVWDCPSAQRRAGLRRAAGLSLPLSLLLSRSSYFWPLGIVVPSRDQAEVTCSSVNPITAASIASRVRRVAAAIRTPDVAFGGL
jgi:hypothetical protein